MLIAVIIVYDEERLLGDCLRSVMPYVDRTIVVDGQIEGFPGVGGPSTDNTTGIVLEAGAELIPANKHAWANEVEKRNQALVGQEGDWYFSIDADERLTTPLPKELPGISWQVRVSMIDCYVWRPRFFKHCGEMRYDYVHDAVFSDGQLITNLKFMPKLHSVHIWHVQQQRSKERRQRKRAYYYTEYTREHPDRERLGM